MSKPLIGIVNDDTAFLDLMSDLLTEEGYDTFIGREGDKAYALIKRRKPDLVILDIGMEHPEAGWLVLEMLRLDPQLLHLPVILCSADTAALRSKEQRLRDLHCGVLEKPFDLNELLAKVAEFLPPGASRA